MAKRLIALFLLLTMLFTGCSVGADKDSMTNPFRFYYKPANVEADFGLGAVPFEYRDMGTHGEDYSWVLERYLKGPLSSELAAPFQVTTTLEALTLEDGCMYLTLSESFADLTDIDLTVACACITLTCLEFREVSSVSIRVEGKLLGGRREMVMSRDALLTEDLSSGHVEQTFTLYFSDTENRYLIGEEISMEVDPERIPELLLDGLISGPNAAGKAETIPLGTEILSLGISDGVCSVNFSEEFLEYAPRSELAKRLTILSVTNTLTQLDNVDAVAFYVDSKLLQNYGSLDLSQLMTFEERAIGPARTGINEWDMDLYLPTSGSGVLSKLPARVPHAANEAAAQQLLRILLAYADQNGYHTPIPSDTILLSVQTADGCCYVDLSRDFLSGPETDLAVSTIAATLIAGVGCRSVEILVEGEPYTQTEWSQSWFEE